MERKIVEISIYSEKSLIHKSNKKKQKHINCLNKNKNQLSKIIQT
jgi:hypothetical protein